METPGAANRARPATAISTTGTAPSATPPSMGEADKPAPAVASVHELRAQLGWSWTAADGGVLEVRAARVLHPRVYFNTARAQLRPMSLPLMDRLAEFMQAHPDISVLRIEGHTDNRGRADYNLQLSAARAHTIARALVDRGIPCRRLEAVGFGETLPLSGNKTRVGRQRNRRMELSIARHRDVQLAPSIERLQGVLMVDPCAPVGPTLAW